MSAERSERSNPDEVPGATASSEADVIVGIDLGTTNSLVALCDARGPRVLCGPPGCGFGDRDGLLPSVVRFGREPVVGLRAKDEAPLHPSITIHSAKRLMGRSAAELAAHAATLPYRVVAGPRGLASIELPDGDDGEGRLVTPQEVAARVLAELRRIAEASLGRPVRRAVVTVPAYFDDGQRQATRDAGRMAGLEIVRIVNEPTAASLAYGIGLGGAASPARQGVGSPRDERIAVYDFGGGTFDVSVLEIARGDLDGGGDLLQVVATAGDTALGGDDIDRALAEHLRPHLHPHLHPHVGVAGVERRDAAFEQRLRAVAEATKIALSAADEVDVGVLARAAGLDPVDRPRMTRGALDDLARPFVDRTIGCCRRALADAGFKVESIDRVVLVGGSTRMPIVRSAVESYFGRVPYTALDPDRVVALGAAVQASLIAGERRDLLLFDVLPLSLGIETVGGAVAKLVVKNASIPTRAKEMFSTSVDGQTNVKIHVVQGERELVEHCRSLGQFELRGIPPMPAGIPQIEVEFLVDQNGVLDVSAVERRSGKRARTQVVPSYGLTREDVERIERESFVHARADMHVHRVIDLRVNAHLDVQWIQAALDRVREELDPAIVADVVGKTEAVRGFIAAADRDAAAVDANAFHAAKDALDRASVPVHEASIRRSLRG
jgi:molecular chaperone DnaK (HSP70)